MNTRTFSMRNLLSVLLLSAATLTGLAGSAPATIKASLTQQAADWDVAIYRKDKAGIEKNMGEGFRHIGPYADASDGAKFLADILDPALTIDPYTVEDQDIRVYGEIALLSGTARMTGTYQGKPFKSHYRYVDTYNLQHGRWVVVNIQITRFRE
jgi:ketosteroid isomerase-like protein